MVKFSIYLNNLKRRVFVMSLRIIEDAKLLHVDREVSDQPEVMPKLIQVFTRYMSYVCFEVFTALSTQWGHVEHGQFT